jgi:NifU-like protein involved in Fe-S cluster formation
MEYSPRVLELLERPANAGELPNADATGVVGKVEDSEQCIIQLRIENDVILAAGFLCKGCPGAIASTSAAASLAVGKSLDEADEVTEEAILEYLGGLPEDKQHCASHAVEALRAAIWDYVFAPKERG